MSDMPKDPWAFELTADEIRERAARFTDDDIGKTFLEILDRCGHGFASAKVTLETITNMPSLAETMLAVSALDDEQREWALRSLLMDIHRHRLSPEDYERWSMWPHQPGDEPSSQP